MNYKSVILRGFLVPVTTLHTVIMNVMLKRKAISWYSRRFRLLRLKLYRRAQHVSLRGCESEKCVTQSYVAFQKYFINILSSFRHWTHTPVRFVQPSLSQRLVLSCGTFQTRSLRPVKQQQQTDKLFYVLMAAAQIQTARVEYMYWRLFLDISHGWFTNNFLLWCILSIWRPSCHDSSHCWTWSQQSCGVSAMFRMLKECLHVYLFTKLWLKLQNATYIKITSAIQSSSDQEIRLYLYATAFLMLPNT